MLFFLARAGQRRGGAHGRLSEEAQAIRALACEGVQACTCSQPPRTQYQTRPPRTQYRPRPLRASVPELSTGHGVG
eukprot:245532-Rhodomonas_salina.1